MSLPFRLFLQEVRRGKSIGRILTNHVLQQWQDVVRGVVVDLGSGSAPSYWRSMKIQENPRVERLVQVDCNMSCHPTLMANLNDPLPFQDRTADVTIVGSVLMLLPEPPALLAEIRRVLKPGGNLLLYTSLIWNYCPDPHDYWRFTEEALLLLLGQAGFEDITIVPVGGRWTAASYLLSPFLRPRWIVPLVAYWLSLKLDAWTEKRFRLPGCPIGHVAKARKSM